MAVRSRCESEPNAGIEIPGLIPGASRIHFAMFSGVFSMAPAPRVRREP